MYSTAELIYLWRLDRGLTQGQLAQACRVPQPNLSNIEKGKADVTLGTLRKISQALKIRTRELVEGTGPQYRGPKRPLTRTAYTEIAESVFSGRQSRHFFHQYLADRFRQMIPEISLKRSSKKQLDLAWSNLKTSLTREEFNQILEKIREHQLRCHEH